MENSHKELRVSGMWLDEQIVGSGELEELLKSDSEDCAWMLKMRDEKRIGWKMDYGG